MPAEEVALSSSSFKIRHYTFPVLDRLFVTKINRLVFKNNPENGEILKLFLNGITHSHQANGHSKIIGTGNRP